MYLLLIIYASVLFCMFCLVSLLDFFIAAFFFFSILFSIVDYDTTALSITTSALPYFLPVRLLDQRAGPKPRGGCQQ